MFAPSRIARNFLRSQPAWNYGDKSKCLDLNRKTFDFAKLSSKDTYSILTSSIVPRPIALVSTLSADGIPNLAPFSYFSMVGHDPPLVSIAFALSQKRSKHTRENTLATGQFTVNIVNQDFVAAANATSVEAPAEVDEWKLAGLTPMRSQMVQPACLYFHKDLTPPDSEVVTTTLVLGLVRLCHVHESVLDPERRTVKPDKLRPVARMGGKTYATIEQGFELERPSWKTAKAVYESVVVGQSK
ncbi:hypothetical protein C8F01DRAFT_1103152 [Mycena amicta]|nr:hypothetical protein C8F01DRAFT_1103152 [Mycena amicta]